MAATIEVKYFNSFWAKKTNCNDYTTDGNSPWLRIPNWTGLPFKRYANDSNNNSFPNYYTFPLPSPPQPIPDIDSANPGNWFIEESRIKGGYNNTSTDYGVKAYLVNSDYVTAIRENKVIYSGLFNSETNVNETNVFSEATNITFTAPPEYGSIQRLYTSDTKLHIFQENKISRALVDKDAIYAADGQGSPVSTTKLVIGEIIPYVGEYGISSNPESWAQFGNRQYFSDKNRNTVLRLAENGLTEIAKYGMSDFFRDKLNEVNSGFKVIEKTDSVDGISPSWPYNASTPIPNSNQPYLFANNPGDEQLFKNAEVGAEILINGIETGCYVEDIFIFSGDTRIKISDLIPFQFNSGSTITFRTYARDKVLGAYDVYNDNYLISIQPIDSSYSTVVFDEKALGWVTFYDYQPTNAVSLFDSFYTTSGKSTWVHNSENVPRNSFYNASPVDSSIEFIFNDKPNIVKTFKTVSYEGSSGWEVDKMESDETGMLRSTAGTWSNFTDNIGKIKSYYEGQYVEDGVIRRAGFNKKENRYVANVVNNSAAQVGEVLIGGESSGIKGYFTTVKIKTDATTAPGETKELFAVGTEYVLSSY